MNKMELLLERQRGNMDGISPSSVRCCNSIFEFKYLSWTRSGLPLRESLSISRETFPTDFSVERKKKRKEKERRRERRERREAN